MRHLTHHRLETVNYGKTTIFWDVVFGSDARIISERLGLLQASRSSLPDARSDRRNYDPV
jgi:hypothetical protein